MFSFQRSNILFQRQNTSTLPSIKNYSCKTSERQCHQSINISDTRLHGVALTEPAHTIKKFIDGVGNESAQRMLKITNDKGLLPIDLVQLNPQLKEKEKSEVKELFLQILKESYFKPITEPINIDNILKRYHHLKNQQLNFNINILGSVANEIREKITESATHPQLNSYEVKDQLSVHKKIEDMRKLTWNFICQNDLKKYSEAVLNCKVANCFEYSFVTFNNVLEKNDRYAFSNVYEIKNSDHVFFVLSEVQLEPNHFSSWPATTLICDSWAGDIYSANDIPLRLSGYRRFTDSSAHFINVTCSFNKNYHKISTANEYFREQSNFEKNIVFFNKYLAKRIKEDKIQMNLLDKKDSTINFNP